MESNSKTKISDLTAGDANELLRTLAELREHLDEEDEALPTGLISGLEQLRKKLQVTSYHTPSSTVDPATLLRVGIKTAPLLLSPEVISDIERLGIGTTAPGQVLSMDSLKELIGLARRHVSPVTEAGCRILINIVLLRVVSVLSTEEMDVNIIPQFPFTKSVFSDALSVGSVIDLLLTKSPSRYTRYLLLDPTSALANPSAVDWPTTCSFFEAKRDNVRAAIPQAAMAVASHCKQHSKRVSRGCATSGEQWVFFVYAADEGEGGQIVACSEEFSLGKNLEGLPLVLGLLMDWVNHATEYNQEFFTYK